MRSIKQSQPDRADHFGKTGEVQTGEAQENGTARRARFPLARLAHSPLRRLAQTGKQRTRLWRVLAF